MISHYHFYHSLYCSDEQGFRLAPLTELGVELPPLPYYLQPKVGVGDIHRHMHSFHDSCSLFHTIFNPRYKARKERPFYNFLRWQRYLKFVFNDIKLFNFKLAAFSSRSDAQGGDAFDLHLFHFTRMQFPPPSPSFKPKIPPINPALLSLHRIDASSSTNLQCTKPEENSTSKF